VSTEVEVPANPADYAIGDAVDLNQDDPVDGKEKRRRSRSSSRTPKNCVVPETPLGEQGSSGGKKGKSRVIKVNAADGKTLEELGKTLEALAADAIQNGKSPKPRDIDPSSKPPAPALVRQVAEMPIEDSAMALPVELGIRSTARREAALKRLKRILQIKYLMPRSYSPALLSLMIMARRAMLTLSRWASTSSTERKWKTAQKSIAFFYASSCTSGATRLNKLISHSRIWRRRWAFSMSRRQKFRDG
jgi:hypothetical protein